MPAYSPIKPAMTAATRRLTSACCSFLRHGTTVYSRTLQRAAEKVGGVEKLQERLKISARILRLCIEGKVEPPQDVFLRAVDLLNELDKELSQRSGGPAGTDAPGRPERC